MPEQEAPAVLWRPSPARVERSRLKHFMDWLKARRGLDFQDYHALWQWSVDDIAGFWGAFWDYLDVRSYKPYEAVLENPVMPGARWFKGAEVNLVDQIFRHETDKRPALLFAGEQTPLERVSWADLKARTASVAAYLRQRGVKPGDRVAAYAPNTPETMIAFLACASIGAVWSVCSPDMGVASVLDRFRQIEPVLLFAAGSCDYNGKTLDKSEALKEIADALPSLRDAILLPGPLPTARARAALPERLVLRDWKAILAEPAPLLVQPLAFDHPLWIVYSSGTTGLPKPIVHGHGGVMLEMTKMTGLHNDIGPDDVFHWYSSTGWIMWNAQVGALGVGATVAIYDGSPSWPDWGRLWRFAADAKLTFFGAGAAFFANCLKAGVEPTKLADLSSIRSIGSTGSPLSEDAYAWIYKCFGPEVWLTPISGGTDFAGAFVGGCVLLPVHIGEMQVRCLGAAIAAFDEAGKPLVDEVGELVCTKPLPSMPLHLWNDKGNERYIASYFDMYPGVWRHGDWIRITPRGGAIIYGRSDATINRYGLRLGTAEIYRAVEELPEVLDSLVVDLEYLGRDSYMPLFVVLRPGVELTEAMKAHIAQAIRNAVSARFVPNDIFQIEEVPRTLSGKKLEVPVKKILLGQEAAKVANPGAMANPGSLEWFSRFALRRMQAAS